MHTRRLVKRSILGSRVYAPSPTDDGTPLTGVVQAVKQENRGILTGPRRSVYTVLLQDGSLKEFSEDEIAVGFNQTTAKGPLKSSLKHTSSNGAPQTQVPDVQRADVCSLSPEAAEELRVENGRRPGRPMEPPDREHPRSVSLLEQKRKVVSCSIDVPHAR
ncbi:zinc finger protein 704-like [Hypomesus transpacificus]|uniref:zinc finger protein 704-like n=1 Tax=Hypomesus transpacificus TaxID=137520 RepID=UPI001F07F222|nr:zinc finger protein 704-like [Hypomesus transpacificus]